MRLEPGADAPPFTAVVQGTLRDFDVLAGRRRWARTLTDELAP
ncbi:MAG TPA: hypothetical protein RMG48_21110 [Myxococcales bacterium LLY-WYZ-16_1]|nr:hypothetical protein [Myxococcales bacterium LLY-WYZ-16_1]